MSSRWSFHAARWVVFGGLAITLVMVGMRCITDHYRPAGPEYLVRLTFGARSLSTLLNQHQQTSMPEALLAGFVSQARYALVHDRWVILGYFLVLMTCAVIFRLLAFSRSSKRLSCVILIAVVVTTVADLIKNGLILWVLDGPSTGLLAKLPDGLLIHGPAAMATVKWSALLVAILAVPAALISVFRVGLSSLRRFLYRRRHRDDWWDAALPPAPAEPAEDDAEAAWRRAYHVPGADELIPKDGRTHAESLPTALCLSGGGIRSACVAMGAMQALSMPRGDVRGAWSGAPTLDDFDYVISVSGGGYSAGARLLAIQRDFKAHKESDELTPGEEQAAPIMPLSSRFSPGSAEFAFLRRRSSYIADSPTALLRALAEMLKNLLASLVIFFSGAVILGWVLGWLVATIPIAAIVPVGSEQLHRDDGRHMSRMTTAIINSLQPQPVEALAATAIPLAIAAVCAVVGLICEMVSASKWSTRAKMTCGRLARGATLLGALVFILTVALPALMRLCAPVAFPEDGIGSIVGAIGGAVGLVVGLQYGAALASIWRKGGVAHPSRWTKLLPPEVTRIVLVIVTLTVLLAAWLAVLGIVAARLFSYSITHFDVRSWGPYFGTVAVMTLVLSCIDVTSLSLHPFYRRRLGRTFAVRRIDGKAAGYQAREATWLDTHGKAQAGGPKFVFAAAAAISEDSMRPAPGLNAVSYVMSADYIGGPSLGWLKTPELRKAAPARIKRDLTVQAAMAVSGAAFSSAMGRNTKGFQTLLALSGARLGTWLPNPTFVRNAQRQAAKASFPKSLPSVRGAGYFYRELFGLNKSDARLVQVTDGGHYENLGLVEALRRRCRLIYCIDGGGDSPPQLSGLADAIRLAKYELGVEITLDTGEPFGADRLAPGSAEPFPEGHAFHCLNARISKDSVIRGKITYPAAAGLGDKPASTGWLIVAKAVLWRELPGWVLTYAAEKNGQEFPHHKTSDQWFDEAQFSAYTELGRRIGMRVLQVSTQGGPPAPPAPAPRRVRYHDAATPKLRRRVSGAHTDGAVEGPVDA